MSGRALGLGRSPPARVRPRAPRPPPLRPRRPAARLGRGTRASALARRLGGRALASVPRPLAARPRPARRRARLDLRLRAAAARRSGRQLLALRLAAPQRAQLGERVGERALGVGKRRLELEIAAPGPGRAERAPAGVDLGRRGARSAMSRRPVAVERLELRGEPRLAQLGRRRRLARAASCAARRSRSSRGPRGRARPTADSGRLGGRSAPPSPGRPRRAARSPGCAPRPPSRGRLVPAGVGEASRAAASSSAAVSRRRLLLGLRGQPPRLRPQLGEDVLDPGEVRLGLGQLLLGPAAPPLVAPDAGDLLEQRPPLLGPQRERLVDHALADEQERVVGEVRRVEQVDEVAQPDRCRLSR